MSAHSRAVRGSLMRRAATTPNSTADASTKRTAAKLTGGRSLNPSLMNSHVEPQMQQSSRKTTRAFIEASIREARRKGKAEESKRQKVKGKREDEESASCLLFCLLPFAF